MTLTEALPADHTIAKQNRAGAPPATDPPFPRFPAGQENNLIERARRYLAATPPAVSGCGGDIATYRAACSLTKGFNLGMDAALPLLREWNDRCSPPWSESELRAKLASAAKSTRPPGWLCADRRAPEDKTTKRGRWPVFKTPTAADIERLAARRHVSTEAVYLMATHGFLWRCRWQEEECYAIHTDTFAQVRRMDGQPLQRAGGKPVKALCLPGSEGSFLNPGGLGGPEVPVLMTEGAVSILEAAEAVLRADRITDTVHSVALFAAVSAGSRFTESTLAPLAGRRVRILADADAAGEAGAAAWMGSLRSVGCTVDCVHMPRGLHDPGDALQAIPARDLFWTQLITF